MNSSMQQLTSYGNSLPPLETSDVAAYFSKRFGKPATITSMRPTFPGMSRETWISEANIGSEPQGFAVRLDYPWGGSCPFTLRQEWQVYSSLWKSPVPVAEPLWFDEGIDFAQGRPHMVRRLVDGSTSIPGLGDPGTKGDRLRQKVAFECAEKLAALHTLDWKKYGLDKFLTPPSSTKGALLEELRYWRKLWDAGRTAPYPVIEEALCWLEENIPAETPRISLCKGNNGIGEEIWRSDKIIAMSDWELACLGDGVLDLAFSQGTLTLSDFGATLRHYEQCVGHDISPQRLAAGTFVTWFKMIVCCYVYMANRFIDGRDKRLPNLSFAVAVASGIERRLSTRIGKDLVAAWSAVATEEQSSYFRVSSGKGAKK